MSSRFENFSLTALNVPAKDAKLYGARKVLWERYGAPYDGAIEFEVESGFFDYQFISAMTGTPWIANEDTYSTPLWEEVTEEDKVFNPIELRMLAKDDTTEIYTSFIEFYKVELTNITFSPPQYKKALFVTYFLKAHLSAKDSLGNDLEKRAFGRVTAKKGNLSGDFKLHTPVEQGLNYISTNYGGANVLTDWTVNEVRKQD